MDTYPMYALAVIIIILVSFVADKRPAAAFLGMMFAFVVFTDLATRGGV